MIPTATIFSLFIAAVFMTVVPVILLIVLGIKKKISRTPLLFGVLAFFLSQMVLRLPMLNLLSQQGWYVVFSMQFIPYVIWLSLSAGLFEESARLGGAIMLKNNRSYKDVISFGLGHAFFEVILLMGVSNISNFIFCWSVNSGNGLFTSTIPDKTLGLLITQLATVKPINIYLGILERFSAVIFHIFATVLVFTGIVKKKNYYYLFAIIAHTIFNLLGALLVSFIGVVAAEIILLIMALAGGYYVIKSKDNFIIN